MSLPEAYQKEIQALDYKVLESQPKDILQFCADFFLSRLAAERLALLSPTSTKKPPETEDEPPEGFADLQAPKPTMAPGGFKMPFPGSLNPFGGKGDKADAGASKAAKKDVIEEEENDTVASPTTPSFGNTASGGPASFRPPFGGDLADDAPPGPLRSPPNPDTYPAQYNFGRRTSVSAESLKPMQDGDDNWTPPFHKKTPEQLERLKAAIEKNFLFSHLDEEQSAQVLGALIEKPIPAKDIKVC